jgi:hypothetical protein
MGLVEKLFDREFRDILVNTHQKTINDGVDWERRFQRHFELKSVTWRGLRELAAIGVAWSLNSWLAVVTATGFLGLELATVARYRKGEAQLEEMAAKRGSEPIDRMIEELNSKLGSGGPK